MMNEPDPIPVHTAEDWYDIVEDDGQHMTSAVRGGVLYIEDVA